MSHPARQLAAAQIAWKPQDDEVVAGLLRGLGYEGIELAPTIAFTSPVATSSAERTAYRRRWEARGLRIVAMQALLFGRPELQLFGDAAARAGLDAHLRALIDLGADLGAHALVFGSPRNRVRGALAVPDAMASAAPFFRAVGDYAAARGTALCLEANPVEYGCDFATTTAEAAALVALVDSPGFRLHLDASGLALAGDAAPALRDHAGEAIHFHASEPHLVPVGTSGTDHLQLAAALDAGGYRGWVSVEMRAPGGTEPLAVLERSLAHVAAAYGPSRHAGRPAV